VRIEELDHTADVGFVVEAEALAPLFEGAAAGLSVALGLSPGLVGVEETGGSVEPLELSAGDLDRLLVGWLRELLWKVQSERRLPRIVEVDVNAGDGRRPATLSARIRWSEAGEAPTREIKGVTYHGLRVERNADGWRALVIFDV
jgi:SHS2 domain-containing protein